MRNNYSKKMNDRYLVGGVRWHAASNVVLEPKHKSGIFAFRMVEGEALQRHKRNV